MPTKDGRLRQVSKPAISICARHGSHAQSDTSKIKIQANGLLDTGADMSVVPLWLLWQLGIAVNEESRLTAYSVSGQLAAYRAEVGLEIRYGNRWLDIGVVKVLAPDTPWSRDPAIHRPFLLGLRGFFDKFGVCVDHCREEFWLGRTGGWPGTDRQAGPGAGAP